MGAARERFDQDHNIYSLITTNPTGTNGNILSPIEAPIPPTIIFNNELMNLRMNQFLPLPEIRVLSYHDNRRYDDGMNSDSEDSDNSNISFVNNLDISACTEYTKDPFIVEE